MEIYVLPYFIQVLSPAGQKIVDHHNTTCSAGKQRADHLRADKSGASSYRKRVTHSGSLSITDSR